MAFSSSSKKKAKKNTTISQFFRDRMQSHRQRTGTGSPLVVETGFPASLVDLIVKNRQRLRRSSEGSFIQESPASPPAVRNHVAEEEEDDAVQETVPDVEKCRGFLPAVLMLCVVSVLALGAKKFALGLTMSAFLLIFMESMGKNVFGLLIPCHDWKKQFGLMMAKILRFIGIGFGEPKIGSNGSDFREKTEIEIIKPEDFLAVDSIGDVECKEMGTDRNSKIRKSNSLSAFLEEEEEDVFELKKKKKWQKAKMKSKLKHIFAKREKKKKKDARVCSNVESSERSSECPNDLALSELKEEAVAEISPEEEPTKKKKCSSNSGCLIVCTIVLIGLSGGRMYALLLILSCCLLKKSGCGMFMRRQFSLHV